MIRTIYGFEAVKLIFRAALCAIFGHPWSINREACDRCDLYREELWRIKGGGPAPRVVFGEPVEAADAFSIARALGLSPRWPGIR